MLICFLDFDSDEITHMNSSQAGVGDMIYKIGNQKVLSQYEDAFDVESEVNKYSILHKGRTMYKVIDGKVQFTYNIEKRKSRKKLNFTCWCWPPIQTVNGIWYSIHKMSNHLDANEDVLCPNCKIVLWLGIPTEVVNINCTCDIQCIISNYSITVWEK